MHSIPIAEDDAPPALDEPAIDLSSDLRGRVVMGRYELAELFFHGELGSVYLGHDQHSGRPVEIKILAPAAATAGVVERFRERSRRMLGVTNVSLASVYGEGLTENGLPFVITEHREGRNLHHMHGDPRLAWPAPEALVRQLAEALQAMHAVGVVHGAVSPGNIVWIEDGARAAQVQLVDREFRPAAAAPEAELDPSIDLYALGSVIHELCTGRPPDESPSDMRDPDAPITVPAPFESVILALVDRNPAGRPVSAMALLDMLDMLDMLDRATASSGMDAGDLEFLAALEEPGAPARFQPVEPSRPLDAAATARATDAATAQAAARWPSSEPYPVAPPLLRPPSQPVPAAPLLPRAPSQPFPGALTIPSQPVSAAPQLLATPPTVSAVPASATGEPSHSSPEPTHSEQPVLFALDPLGDRITPSPTPVTATPTAAELTPPSPTPAPEPATLPSDATAKLPSDATPTPTPPRKAPRKAPAPAPASRSRLVLGLIGLIGLIITAVALALLIWLIQSCRDDVSAPPVTETPSRPVAPVVVATPPVQPKKPPEPKPVIPTSTPITPEPATTPITPEPATTPIIPEPAPGALLEQLSAQEFRKIMLRSNRTTQVRTCYRRHARPGEEEVSVIGIVSTAGKIQKLRMEPAILLTDCLRPIVQKMEFPGAQRPAQHNFTYKNLFPDG